MTIQDLGALGELIGSAAVLATLVYLTLQTRQNTRAIRAQLDGATLSANIDALMAVAGSSALSEAVRQDREEWSDLTTGEMQTLYYFQASLQLFAWEFQQAQRGLLSTQEVEVMAIAIRSWLTQSRAFPRWWEVRISAYPSDFVDFVEGLRPAAA